MEKRPTYNRKRRRKLRLRPERAALFFGMVLVVLLLFGLLCSAAVNLILPDGEAKPQENPPAAEQQQPDKKPAAPEKEEAKQEEALLLTGRPLERPDRTVAAEALLAQPVPLSREQQLMEKYPELMDPATGQRRPVMAITFDDGPFPGVTPYLLEELAKRDVKVTFFLLGSMVANRPDLAQDEAEAGHQICAHAWEHRQSFTDMNSTELAEDIELTVNAIYNAIGEYPLYLRPLYGEIDQKTAAQIDLPLMLWNIDPKDWDTQDADTIRDDILRTAMDGGVVLLHDSFLATVDGTMAAIDQLQAEGYLFVTMEQYYEIFGIEPKPGKVYRGCDEWY